MRYRLCLSSPATRGWAITSAGRDARSFSPEKIDANRLTHINYAFANIVDGKVAIGDPAADEANFSGVRALKKAHPKLKILASVGGCTGSKYFSNVALTPASRRLFANSTVAYLQQYQIDGVDLDWEFPVGGRAVGNSARPQDKQNLTLLLKAMRSALHAAGKKTRTHYLLTIAGSPAPILLRTPNYVR